MNIKKIGFWTATVMVALPNLGAGAGYITGAMDEAMLHLGFPLYFATMLGVWKILGAAALLSPRFAPWVDDIKGFAYAGYLFVFTSAVYAHVSVGDSIGEIIAPAIMAALLVVSYVLRPRA